jgi:hypothetical protein
MRKCKTGSVSKTYITHSALSSTFFSISLTIKCCSHNSVFANPRTIGLRRTCIGYPKAAL